MIGLDSNIILRAVANDDPVQSPLARQFLADLSRESPGVLNCVVVAEICWSLRVRYKRQREEVLRTVESILRSPAYVVTNRDAINRALSRCHDESLEFPDALIGELNLLAGCKTTMTFDREASQSGAFTALA